MDREQELAIVRRAFAKQIMALSGMRNARLEAAFARVKREAFLGPGPWNILRWQQYYLPTPDDDPVYLYTDDLFGISLDAKINNGQPSFHASLITSVMP